MPLTLIVFSDVRVVAGFDLKTGGQNSRTGLQTVAIRAVFRAEVHEESELGRLVLGVSKRLNQTDGVRIDSLRVACLERREERVARVYLTGNFL